ncbi:response regulator [Spirosoma validum]|uniref:Response regulator transcription factor n=1 Tax=Spirosoma validum TaxID=2771355 RepID=A0A927GF55_9BACT|nr:response regulator transcription factor [Spirosoma validum]MBD2755290.1 response regulator transcription factor [Spirosoma validum]
MRIVIVDDHKLLTDAIALALRDTFDESQLRVYNNPLTFIDTISPDRFPDVVVTDLLMPQMSGLDLLQTLRTITGNRIKVIILTSVTDAQSIRQALRSGANAYIAKDASLKELPEAIQEVMNGQEFISPSLQKSLIKSIITEEQHVFYLSPREKEVLKKICAGMTVKEIAHNMELSAHTVQTYLKKIMKKFKVNRTADLIVFALRHGLYTLPPK